MTKNKIYTINEYMEQGFTEAEAYAVRIHDRICNKKFSKELTDKDYERIDAIVKRLGL